MNYSFNSSLELTDKQKEVILHIAKADERLPYQVLAQLLATGIEFLYGDVATNDALHGCKPCADDLANEIKKECLYSLGFISEEEAQAQADEDLQKEIEEFGLCDQRGRPI